MKIVSTPPRLVCCAALWSLEGHPSPRREWSLLKKVAAIAAAGFEGVCAYATPELRAAAAARGLRLMSGIHCPAPAPALPQLRAQAALGVRFINVQLGRHNTPPAAAARFAAKVVRAGRTLGLAVHIETHRDTATETPEKFTELARLYRRATGERLPVTWDHSHFAVMKHILPRDYTARLLAWPELIQRSQMFHLRPFNGQHCQVPVTDGRGRLTPEFRDYLAFAEKLFALWLAGPRPGGELWACPELGMTHGYHVSTNPLVWPDVIRAHTELRGAWRRAMQRFH